MPKGEEDASQKHWSNLIGALVHPFFSCYYRLEREKSQGIDPSKSGGSLKTAEEVKAHLENQLKQARLAAQQVSTPLHWGCQNYSKRTFKYSL